MTYYERVDELRDHTNFTTENFEIEYLTAELILIDLFREYIIGAEINNANFGTGNVTGISGNIFDQITMEVSFPDIIKRYGVQAIITGKVFFSKTSFANILEVGDAWDHAFDLHTDITRNYSSFRVAARQAEADAAKKAAADKKAEEQYENAKTKAIKEFETRASAVIPRNSTEEFYYSLGWLTKHIGSVTAKLPDYLEYAFEKHFGTDAPKTLIDSKAKTSGGFAKQWSWEFVCGVKDLKNSVVPTYLTTVTSDISKGIHNTSFIWDLVDNYGFQFGKKQDVDKIKSYVPEEYFASFEAGLK